MDHFFEILKEVVEGGEVLLVFGFVFGAEFENDFEALFLEEAFAKVVDDLLLFFDKVLQHFMLFALLFAFVFVHKVLLLVELLNLELLVVFGQLLVLVYQLVQFLLLLLNVRLYVRKLVVRVLLYHPLQLWKHFVRLHPLHGGRLELLSQRDELHILLAVLIYFTQKYLRLVYVLLVLQVQALLSHLQLFCERIQAEIRNY